MKRNRLELVRTLSRTKEYDSFSGQYNYEYLHKVHVIIDDELWGDIVILETCRPHWGSDYITTNDWQSKQPETIADFYKSVGTEGYRYLDTDEKWGTATDPITNIVYDASDIV